MKHLKFIYTTIFFTLILIACEEDANFPETRLGIIPTVDIDESKEVFDLNNRATTAVEFTLDYNNFGGDLIADTIFIRVASGAALNTNLTVAASVPLKYVPDFPATVTVTLAEICTALGLDINTVTTNRSFELFFTLKDADGNIFQEGTNLHPGVIATNSLGYYRYRFFSGCKTGVEEGYYTATLSGGNRLNINSSAEVLISKQVVTLEGANAYLNFLRDIFSITDISAGFYPKSGLNPTLISNQPVGIREVCGTYSLFNNALLTVPSPNPQVTFTVTSGSWDASTKTLTLNWTDATNTITETTTFVKVRDL
jgi:hypothetical protein